MQNAKSSTTSHFRLSDLDIQKLLQDLEKTDLSRTDIDFKRLCKDSPLLYGEPASRRIKAFQKRFSKIKKKRIEEYIKTLKYHNITPGSATANEVTKAAKSTAASAADAETLYSTDEDVKEEVKGEDDIEEDETDEDETDEDDSRMYDYDNLSDDFGNMEPPTIPRRVHLSSPARAQRNNAAGIASPAGRSTTASPAGRTSFTPSTPLAASLPRTIQFGGDGTKRNPIIVAVNLEYPERHHGFEIEEVYPITVRGTERSVYEITRNMCPADLKLWTAETSLSGFPEEYNHRLVMITSPSISYPARHVKRYYKHADSEHNAGRCDRTIAVHTATETQIKNDPNRQHCHYLLVFPPGVVLDNAVLSQHASVVKRDRATLTIKEDENEIKKVLRTGTAIWRIADAQSKQVSNDTNSDEPELSELFA